jgi:hypothetical protein
METKMVNKRFILGIGILIILLALAGTGSANPGAPIDLCVACHNFDGNFFNNTHKFDGISRPLTATSCAHCHAELPTNTEMSPNMHNLTSNGSFYNSTHRYNASTLASVKLTVPGCANCHVNVIGNNFNLITGTPTYLTSSVCEDCHKSKYDNWSNTTHAHMLTPAAKAQTMGLPTPPGYSWSNISYVLVTKFQLSYINATGYWLPTNDTYNTETQTWSHMESGGYTCGSCHTTGYNATGVNSLPGIKGTFTEPGIACERCHGPAGNGHQVVVNYSATLCTSCHSGSKHGTGWENGEHAPPAAENGSSCMKCHSPFDKYKNPNVTLANTTAQSCGVCHNTHDISDSKYADTFSNNNFNADTWANVSNAKLSFFNATASVAAGTDIFDNLTLPSNVVIYPGSNAGIGSGPINLTGRPVSEALCSECHYNHGLAHTSGVNLTHGTLYYGQSNAATCTDCHMRGANATVGRDMMPNHANDVFIFANQANSASADPANTCGGTKNHCHTSSSQDLNNSTHSMVPIFNGWNASAHNDKVVSIGGAIGNHFYGTFNATTDFGTARPNTCLQCKSPINWNPLNTDNVTPVNLTDFHGVSCMVCHDLHDMGAWLNKTGKAYAWYNKTAIVTATNATTGLPSRYQAAYTMMDNTTQLCGNCHDNIRAGNTGPGWAPNATTGVYPNNPNSPHGVPAAAIFIGSWKQTSLLKFECIDCHWSTLTTDSSGSVLPDSQKVGGHSFKVNVTLLQNGNGTQTCSNCHQTGTKLGNLSTTIASVQAATQAKWNSTNTSVTSALATIKASSGVSNLSRNKIAQAYWNLKLVSSEGSWGVHNPTKDNQLLDDAANLTKESIASLGPFITSVNITPTTPSAGSEMNITVAINNPNASFNGRVEGNVWLPDGSGKYLGWETVIIPSGASTVTITGAAGGNESSYIPHTSGAYLYDVFLENVDMGQVYTNWTDSKLGVHFTVGTASSVYISNVSLSSAPRNGSVMTLSVTISNPTASAFNGTMDSNIWDSASGHVLTPQNISIVANGSTTLTFSYTPVKTGLHSYDFFMLSPGQNTKAPWGFPCMDCVAGIGFNVV